MQKCLEPPPRQFVHINNQIFRTTLMHWRRFMTVWKSTFQSHHKQRLCKPIGKCFLDFLVLSGEHQNQVSYCQKISATWGIPEFGIPQTAPKFWQAYLPMDLQLSEKTVDQWRVIRSPTIESLLHKGSGQGKDVRGPSNATKQSSHRK